MIHLPQQLFNLCIYTAYFIYRQSVFLIITVASVVTNAGLAVFTMQNLDSYSTVTRYWCFIGFQWICFSLQVGTFSAGCNVTQFMHNS